MFGKADPQQQWSVHAEFTISHPRSDPENLPQAHTEQADNGVRMTYTWTSSQGSNAWSAPPSTSSDGAPKYGFQKGNLLFTSTPPRRVHDSGYGSDLLSPNSYRRPVQPYNRKCRSTCNIVLSTNIQDENRTEDAAESVHTQCGRTQSLRCQTPTLRCERKDNFYGCGDPWCHHYEDFSGRFSPVMETCEDCPSGQASTKTFSTIPRECESRKDACVQTFEMIDKCTSPFVKMGKIKYAEYEDRKDKREKKKYGSGSRRRTEPIFQRSQSPSSITPDSLDGSKVRVSRTRFLK